MIEDQAHQKEEKCIPQAVQLEVCNAAGRSELNRRLKWDKMQYKDHKNWIEKR